MTTRSFLFLMGLLQVGTQSVAQKQQADSTQTSYLPDITVVGMHSTKDLHVMPEIVGTSIYAGKKNALIVVDNVAGNTATNTMRQVMAKIPGIHVWESDGSGIQIGIASRGLSPNRSWEFNVRQNGYDVAADPFGYPEAYYNPPLQAVQRIENVKGQGALQYGPQFGGMINYIIKNGSDIKKPIQLEVNQTNGSNGLTNTYTSIGGEKGKWHYYTYFDHRAADGWRQNSRYFTNAGFSTVTFKPSNQLSITAEALLSHIRSQQPGGLTDAQFNQDSRVSNRSRNWMDISWNTYALTANWQISASTKLNVKAFAVSGDRNSLGFLKALDVKDSINSQTLQYNNRVLDIDKYRNYGVEPRLLHQYKLGNQIHSFSAGLRFFVGNTYRYRDGVGTTGSNFENVLINNFWPRNIRYQTYNYAVFAENLFKVGQKWSFVPGVRYEHIQARVEGINGYDANGKPIYLQQQQRSRSFPLFGLGIQYAVDKNSNLYFNVAQAYRPVQFADLTAPPTTDSISNNLTDAKGYNADLGFRGKIGNLINFDVSIYYLRYNNRIGTLSQQRADGSFYNYRTNVGNSHSKGLEAFADINLLKLMGVTTGNYQLSCFVSYAYNDARYGQLTTVTRSGSKLDTANLYNKQVENAPQQIVRGGLTMGYKTVALTLQTSHVGGCFSDANNTEKPSANGQVGFIPSYTITDATIMYQYQFKYQCKAGINNVFNAAYFTRRSGGYPGPGLLPSDGRTFFVTIGVKI